MDKLSRYREIIRKELEGYATWLAKPNGQLRFEVVFDPALDHFELVGMSNVNGAAVALMFDHCGRRGTAVATGVATCRASGYQRR